MSFFRDINKIEDGVRRDLLTKEKTEKMGVPVKMGISDDRTETTPEDEQKSLMGAISLYGAARRSGNLRKEEFLAKPQPPEKDPQVKQQVDDHSAGAGQDVESAGNEDDKSDYQSEVGYDETYKDDEMGEDEDDEENCVFSKDLYGEDKDEEIREYLKKNTPESIPEPDGEPAEGEDVVEGNEEEAAAPDPDEEPIDAPEGDGEQLTVEIDEEEDKCASIESDIEKAKDRPAGSFWYAKHPAEKGKKPQKGLWTKTKEGKDVPVKKGSEHEKRYKKLVSSKKTEYGKTYTPPAKAKKSAAKKPSTKGEGEEKAPSAKPRAHGPEGNVQPKDLFGATVDVKGLSGTSRGRAHRQRRHPGELWFGRYGVGKKADRMVLWTKWEDTSIVRVKKGDADHTRAQKLVSAGKFKPGESYIPEGAGEHYSQRYAGKVSSKHAKIIQTATSRGKRITKESEEKIRALWKEWGIKFSPEQIKSGMYKRMLDELAGHKMNLGSASKWARTPAQVRRDFIDGMDASNYKNRKEFDAARKRVTNLSPQQFEIMMRAIMLEDDEMPAEAGAAKSFDDQLGAIIKSMVD